VVGRDKTLLVDTGHPALWHGLRPTLHAALGGRDLDYVMPTHAEIPHAGALTLLYREWPGLTVIGNTQDYHLYHPELPAGSYQPMRRGEVQSVDLGGRRFDVLPALFKDLGNTVWGFDHGTRTLFPADAFACMHWHSKEHCGLTLEEIGPDPQPSNVHFIVSGAEFRNLDRKLDEFDALIAGLDVRILAPAHGTVITDARRARWFLDGLRRVSAGV
jgi:flavorubredoxin